MQVFQSSKKNSEIKNTSCLKYFRDTQPIFEKSGKHGFKKYFILKYEAQLTKNN
jgi:hypothetical protein